MNFFDKNKALIQNINKIIVLYNYYFGKNEYKFKYPKIIVSTLFLQFRKTTIATR